MPKVLKVVEFRKKMPKEVRPVVENKEEYLFIANETYQDRSFIVTSPKHYIELNEKAGNKDAVDGVKAILESVKERVSNKYRKIRKGHD
jgi:hypothetical protein